MYGNHSEVEQCVNQAQGCCCKIIYSYDNLFTAIPLGIILGVLHGSGLILMWRKKPDKPEKVVTYQDVAQFFQWLGKKIIGLCGTSSSSGSLFRNLPSEVWQNICREPFSMGCFLFCLHYIITALKDFSIIGFSLAFIFPPLFQSFFIFFNENVDGRIVRSTDNVCSFLSTTIIGLLLNRDALKRDSTVTLRISVFLCFVGNILTFGHMPYEESDNYSDYISHLQQPLVSRFMIILLIVSFIFFCASYGFPLFYLRTKHFCQVSFLMSANKLTKVGLGIIMQILTSSGKYNFDLLFWLIPVIVIILIIMKMSLHFRNPIYMATLMCGSDVVITTAYTSIVYRNNFSCSWSDNFKLLFGLLDVVIGLGFIYAYQDNSNNGYRLLPD